MPGDVQFEHSMQEFHIKMLFLAGVLAIEVTALLHIHMVQK